MKKILVLLLCFNIVLAPTYVFANTYLGGWTITNKVMQGASLLIDATKTAVINGANVVKTSNAVIKPIASQVAKMIVKTGAVLAVDLAIKSLIGAVDYVMDPANNQVKYSESNCSPSVWNAGGTCPWYVNNYDHLGTFLNKESAAAAYWQQQEITYSSITCSTQINQTTFRCTANDAKNKYGYNIGSPTIEIRNNPNTSQQENQRTLPYTTVAQEIIDQAETDQRAGAYVGDVANDSLANDAATQSDVETQLNTNAKTQTSEEAAAESTPKDPAAPEAGTNIKITFPVFCSWAPTICEAANVVINFPTTLTNWWNTATQSISASWLSFKEWLDWTKNDSELPETETNQVTELPIPELQENAISWSASCPPDVQVPINLYGQSSTLTFSWSPWCQLLNVIKPAVIASSYIGAAFIVLGLRT